MKGGEIEALRKRAGIDRQDLADLIGVDVRTVISWEDYNRRPIRLSAVKLDLLSQALDAGDSYRVIKQRWRLGRYLPGWDKSTSA